jgi:chromosome segregation ATPase
MTFSTSDALTLAAEAEEDERGFEGRFFYDAERGDIGWIAKACDDKQCDCERKLNADGDQDCSHSLSDWEGEDHICEPIVNMLNRNPQVASMLRAAVARVEELEAETRAVRMTEADLVRMPMSDLDHHKAELLAMLTDRDSLRAKLAEVTKERDALVRVSVHWEEQTVKWRLEAGKYLTERDTARARVHELDAECRSLHEMLTAVEHRAGDAEAALGGMTKERDWAVAVQRAALESQERLGTTLAAALQAKDELADIAETLREAVDTADVWSYVYDEQRNYKHAITGLRSVGKEKP